MKQVLKFEYGEFTYQNISNNEDTNIFPVIKGKLNLDVIPTKNDFYRDFWFYDLSQVQDFKQFPRDQNRYYDNIVCLGPYYPFHLLDENEITPSIFTEILFYSKTSQITNAQNKNFSASWLKRATEGRKQQIRILANIFGKFLVKNNNKPTGTIISVPSKPKYTFNSVEEISMELSEFFNLPNEEILYRKSDNNIENNYTIKPEYRGSLPNEIILVDDIITNGDTANNICKLLKEKGVKKVTVLALGNTDHSYYYT